MSQRSRNLLLRPFLGAIALTVLCTIARAQSTVTPLTLKDTTGADHLLPAKDKLTLLLFLRPGQSQSDEAIKLLPLILKDHPAQILLIVSGDDAAANAAKLAAAKTPYPIITDLDYAIGGRFNTRVWPTTAILNSDNKVTAHLAGLPVTFANDIAAHLDFAAGKLDQAGLDKALANREVVADSVAQKAARHVEVAMRLAEKGMTDQAQAELAKAADLKPTDGNVLLSMARVHLMTGDAKSALALLDKIPAGQIPPGDINTLKGWAAVQTSDWPTAKTTLTLAVKLNPDPAQALYLLARVAEHDNDPATAAKLYRQAFEHTPLGKEMPTLPK